MAKYGVWMLETLVLKYCDHGGSSTGLRAFIKEQLPAFKEKNPQLILEEILRHGRHPQVVACYKNGRSKPICMKNKSPEEIEEEISWLRNSHGRSMEYRVVRCRQLSRNPSIQGKWSGSTFASELGRETEWSGSIFASEAGAGLVAPLRRSWNVRMNADVQQHRRWSQTLSEGNPAAKTIE
eukprot:gene19133-25740_t